MSKTYWIHINMIKFLKVLQSCNKVIYQLPIIFKVRISIDDIYCWNHTGNRYLTLKVFS